MNKEEFKIIFDKYFDNIRSYVYFKSGNKDLAEDVAQEVFIKIWEKSSKIDTVNIKALLYKMASDNFISNYRKQKTKENYIHNFKLSHSEPITESDFEYQELKAKYEDALQRMPEKQRVVFLMSRVEELKYKEISDRLNLSVKAVEKRMKLGLDFLKKELINEALLIIILLKLFNK